MSGQSSISIAGALSVATTRNSTELGLSQVVDTIEAKTYEVTIPANGVDVVVPLPFSSGISEAIVLAMYTPKKLQITLTSSDGTTPGPMKLGIKGHQMLTMYPGEGLVGLKATNPDVTNDVTLVITLGSKAQAADADPAFYK